MHNWSFKWIEASDIIKVYMYVLQGRTHAYAKNGSRVNSFSSHLPGGNYGQKGKSRGGMTNLIPPLESMHT